MTQLILGQTAQVDGNVTTLNWVNARAPSELERSLGFHSGRLADGYWILLLKQPLTPADFEFDGTTLRSGGRMGLPAKSWQQEATRPRVHDEMKAQYAAVGGRDPYVEMQKLVLRDAHISGLRRITKVIPVTRHNSNLAPDVQYPPGSGGLQWKLVRGCTFLVALHVDAAGLATSPSFALSVAQSAPYENRHKVNNWLTIA